jgi:hypothetical protein
MSPLRELALRRLESVGQPLGQGAGQAGIATVPKAPSLPNLAGHDFPRNSAKGGACPTVPPLGARDSGTEAKPSEFRRTPAGTSGGTPALIDERIAVARLKEWHSRLSRIDEFCPPSGWKMNDWLRLVDTACWLYENFASQAAREGWSGLDLFGYLPDLPGWGGLADRLKDARNLKLTEGRACWSFLGVKDRFCRGGALDLEGILPLWEITQ